MRITGVMLQKYGYTKGCDGCRYKRAGMREARPQTKVCRRRIGEAMVGDETDRRKKEEEDERVNWRLGRENGEDPQRKARDGGDDREGAGGCDDRAGAGGGESSTWRRIAGWARGPRSSKRKGPRGSACRRSAGREKRGPQETKEVQGENKRPRENAPEGKSAELPMDLSLIQQRVSVDEAELYSPPLVTAEAQEFGLKTGEAMDILTGWDLPKDEHKRMAKEYIDKYKPTLIEGSPMCAMFSALQNLTP